jgi:hypothetical protein
MLLSLGAWFRQSRAFGLRTLAVLGTLSRSQVIPIETFSPSRGQGLSKIAQFESFAVSQAVQCTSARLSASTKAPGRPEAVTASAGAHSNGIK